MTMSALIEEHRRGTLHRISSIFTSLLTYFREEQPNCSEACSSVSLGTLERSLFRKNELQFHPSSERSLEGYSVSSVIKAAREIKAPAWNLVTGGYSYNDHRCSLSIESLLEQWMAGIKELEGLDLESFERRGCQVMSIRLKGNTN